MKNRWIIMITGILANMCIGAVYSYSVFSRPLMEMLGATSSQATLPYTISLALMPISMVYAGRLQDKHGPKLTMFIGGLIFSSGYFLAGFANSIQFLYISYGVMGGASLGIIYSCTVVNTVKWFPDKRGLAGGLISAGLGVGSIVFAPLGVRLMETYSPLTTFQIFSAIFLILISIASIFAEAPPADYKPEGWVPTQNTNVPAASITIDKDWRGLLGDPLFYIAWVTLVLATISGLMIIGHAATIGEEVVGLTPVAAALGVSILGFANTLGRPIWGVISDRIGRFQSMSIMFTISALSMFLLSSMASSLTVFIIAGIGIGSCYGGFFGLYPAATGDMFGLKNMGINWGIMFTAFAPASLFGPMLATQIKTMNNGDYSYAFIIAGVLSVIGIGLTMYAGKEVKVKKA